MALRSPPATGSSAFLNLTSHVLSTLSAERVLVQEPSTHLALAFDIDDAAMFKSERLDQSLMRSFTQVDPACSAM
jgi:hypothetical protein